MIYHSHSSSLTTAADIAVAVSFKSQTFIWSPNQRRKHNCFERRSAWRSRANALEIDHHSRIRSTSLSVISSFVRS